MIGAWFFFRKKTHMWKSCEAMVLFARLNRHCLFGELWQLAGASTRSVYLPWVCRFASCGAATGRCAEERCLFVVYTWRVDRSWCIMIYSNPWWPMSPERLCQREEFWTCMFALFLCVYRSVVQLHVFVQCINIKGSLRMVNVSIIKIPCIFCISISPLFFQPLHQFK